jgi:hypothetical protein
LEMEAIYKDLDLDYQLHLSKINTEGIKVLNRS